MNKVSLYILMILVFLGLSKSFSPSEQGTLFIENERVIPNYFQGAPIELILVDAFEKGFLIKTYYQRYLLVHAFRSPEQITVRTSKEFWKSCLANLGMSLFQRRERDLMESTVPLPPGTLYVGDPAFGSWEMQDSGAQSWVFHRAYRHFPEILGWGEFRPDTTFHRQALAAVAQGVAYYGPHAEFGPDGPVTKGLVQEEHANRKQNKTDLWHHMQKFFRIPLGEPPEGEAQ